MKKIIPLILLTALVGCSQSLDDKYNELYKAVEGTKKGKESVWLEMGSIASDTGWERVALFFGYFDNQEVCMNTRDIYTDLYGRTYRCIKVKNSSN